MWPNQLILINYPSGAMGAFLKVICEQLLYPKWARVNVQWERARADGRLHIDAQDSAWWRRIDLINDHYNSAESTITQIRKINWTGPLVIADHIFIEKDILAEHFPNYQRIVIQIKKPDLILYRSCFLYKNTFLTSEDIKKDLDDLALVPPDQLAPISSPYNWGDTLGPRDLAINMGDLLFDPNHCQNLLAQFLNAEVSLVVKKTWTSYLQAQRDHMPWLESYAGQRCLGSQRI
jgi:hypothetical protein